MSAIVATQEQCLVKRLLPCRWTLLVLRLILGGVFLYAGILKLLEPLPFADSIASFHLLPTALINLFALGLPPLEIITGGMLLMGWRLRLASFAVLLLSCLFAIALSQALMRGLEVDCGCFGSGKPSLTKTLLALGRDLLLIAAAGWIYGASIVRGGASAE